MDKKDEESGAYGNPFKRLERATVLQEVGGKPSCFLNSFVFHLIFVVFHCKARTFNETPINAKKCIQILTKIIYLINQVRR